EVGLNDVFFNYVSVTAHALGLLRCYKRRPGFAIISCPENIRRHVSERVAIESSVGRARIEVTRLRPTDPRILRQTRNIAYDIGPRFAAVPGELKIAVIGADADQDRKRTRLNSS